MHKILQKILKFEHVGISNMVRFNYFFDVIDISQE